ncbi:MAG: type 4a pilus biogenesis protein PilO [Planctomycetota bacterium JB042]
MNSRRASDLAYVAGLVLAGLTYVQLFYRPAAAEVESQSRRLRTTRAEICKSDDFTRGLDDLERYLSEFRDALAELDRLVPTSVDGDARLREIDAVVGACGLRSRSIRPDPAQPQGPVTAHPLTITVSGSYEQIVRFLFEVESLPRHTRATRITLEPELERDAPLRAQVELTSYSVASESGGNR